jgi:hypothetical protein
LNVDIRSGLRAKALTSGGIFGFELGLGFEYVQASLHTLIDGLAAAEKSACGQDDQIPHAASPPRSTPA